MKEELTRTELRRIAEEFKTERDAAKRDTLRAFDERNILLNENMALTEKCEKLEKALQRVKMEMSDDTKALVKRLRALHILDEVGSNNPLGRDGADTIERLERELAEINAVAAFLAEQCEKLRQALQEAERGFELAYDAAEKGLTDEVLLHCGAHGALISTTLFRVALAAPKEKT